MISKAEKKYPPPQTRGKIRKVVDPNSEEVKTALREAIGLGSAPPLEARKWFHSLEVDGDVLYHLDEEAWKRGDPHDIENSIFTETDDYKSVRKILDRLSAKEFFDYLDKLKRKKIPQAQNQAIQDEIEERML